MVLSDTGFWFAFFNPKDRFHAHSMAVMQRLDEGLITTWQVITETCYLLGKTLGNESQLRFLQAIEAGYVEIFQIQLHHLAHIQKLMQKYADLPMDLADASLVILAEELGHGRILSTDRRDFKTYQWKNHKPFQNLLLPDD